MIILVVPLTVLYLDSYRSRIVDSRVAQAAREARLIGEAIAAVDPALREPLIVRLAQDTGSQIRVFDRDGQIIKDSRALGLRSFVLHHLIHHRGQLTVYARLLDVPVPSIYGPTADEKW